MRRRTTVLVTCMMAVSAVLGIGGYHFSEDPERAVDTIRLDGFTGSSSLPEPSGEGDSIPVDGLEQLAGELRSGDDLDDWYGAGVEVDFGPRAWLLTDPVLEDFDGDGTADPVLDELHALNGSDVTLGVRHGSDEDGERDEFGVFTINGLPFRDADGGPAPWEDPGARSEAGREEVGAAAEEAVGESSRATSIEWTDEDGWEVGVRSPDGRFYDVLLDFSGEVVDIRSGD
ncbi:hypothetical protein GCM10007147_30980 [Nocardiopsis kunsanensis]|uniref:PepSY domain-containing protein n=2 Tax=Nocardiopsis kunsanensis TaxID=141693 RepID=A0A919CJ71_9ACTN|nr:hypothetical protein [Nocardiopsis kunsanensis]GHD29772.1 hypothetical protein GCM10007147_30980 [Nocardiopsis kunsanensis]